MGDVKERLCISCKYLLFILERNSTHQTIIIIRAGIEMFPTIIRAERFAQTCVFLPHIEHIVEFLVVTTGETCWNSTAKLHCNSHMVGFH